MRILTNHPGQAVSPTWESATTHLRWEGNDVVSALKLAWQLYTQRSGYDCVVLGAGRSDILFALMQSILPFEKVPCIMIGCLWYESSSRLKRVLKRAIFNVMEQSVDRFVVWARREIEAYAGAFNLPKEKFVFVPYHTTLDKIKVIPCEGHYVFSGGNRARDYQTLVEAVSGLSVNVHIASSRPELFTSMSIPPNVEIRAYTHEEYIGEMAGCRLNVVSLEAGLLHSGGQQTFLNSMWLGKATVVNDPEGAKDYIEDGRDGILVPPNDPKALRAAIVYLWNNPEKARELGARAMTKAREYSTEEHFKKIVSVVRDVISDEQFQPRK